MTSTVQRTLTAGVAALAFLGTACADATAPAASSSRLSNALTLALSGNDQSQTSFVGAPSRSCTIPLPHGRPTCQ